MHESLAILFMAQPQGQEQGGGNMMVTLAMIGGMILIFYFLMIRPSQKRQAEHKKLLESVKKGDKVLTASGIHGTVAGVEDTAVLLQVADNTKVKFEKSAIATILKSSD